MEKNAVIYIRVSDPSQIENNSLETQEKSCRKFAEAKGFKIIEPIFREEGKSAKHVKSRPVLMQLLSYCGKKSNKVNAVIVYKFDRFSRNLEDGLATISLLGRYSVEVLSVIEDVEPSPMGTAIRSIMMTLGQLDNELKGQRVKDNMIASFRKGMWPFKCPIGYQRKFKTKEENKGLPPIQNPLLAPIIKELFEKASTGIYSKAQLARIMNLAGFGDHYMTKADHKIVKEILEKTFYYGNMYAKKWDEYSMGKHEPITDKPTWDKAYQRVILKKKGYMYQDEELYPLKGILKCELCNEVMTTCPAQGQTKKVFYYECKNKKCRKVRIQAKLAHEQFMDILTKIQPSQRVIKLFSNMVFTEWDRVINQTQQAVEQADKRIIDLKAELKGIRKANEKGIYTDEEAVEQAEKLRQEVTVMEIERSEIKIEQYSAEIVREFIEHFLMNLGRLWEILDLAKKQTLQSKIFVGGLICSKGKEVRTGELSPSFKLIDALKAENSENVTLDLPQPNSIISDLVDLFNTFLPDIRQLGFTLSV